MYTALSLIKVLFALGLSFMATFKNGKANAFIGPNRSFRNHHYPSSHPGVMPVDATTAAQEKKYALSMAAAHDDPEKNAFSNYFWATYGKEGTKESVSAAVLPSTTEKANSGPMSTEQVTVTRPGTSTHEPVTELASSTPLTNDWQRKALQASLELSSMSLILDIKDGTSKDVMDLLYEVFNFVVAVETEEDVNKYLQEIEPKFAKLRKTPTRTQDEDQSLDELLKILKNISSSSP